VKDSGIIIAEVVIAVGILAVVLVGLSDVITRTTQATRLTNQTNEAARAIEARLAYFKLERDRDAKNFFDNIVHNLDGGIFTDCGGNPWQIATKYTLVCTERFTSLSPSGVKAEVKAAWTNKTTNDTSITLSSIITE